MFKNFQIKSFLSIPLPSEKVQMNCVWEDTFVFFSLLVIPSHKLLRVMTCILLRISQIMLQFHCRGGCFYSMHATDLHRLHDLQSQFKESIYIVMCPDEYRYYQALLTITIKVFHFQTLKELFVFMKPCWQGGWNLENNFLLEIFVNFYFFFKNLLLWSI